MSGTGLKIEWQGMDRVQRAIQGAFDRFGGAKGHEEILDVVGAQIESQTRARISAGGPDPDGKPWKRLTAAYQARKRKISSGNILNLRGALRDSITHVASPDEGEVGSNLVYAGVHQRGGKIQRKGGSVTTRHRTDAKGELMRTSLFGGRGLVFAKASHKRVLERTFSIAAHVTQMPARSFLGISSGDLDDLQGNLDSWADRVLEAACGH